MIPTYQPEKLNRWDRWFSRYKTIPVEQGKETWTVGWYRETEIRDFVIYHVIDRLTGGYTIKKVYIND